MPHFGTKFALSEALSFFVYEVVNLYLLDIEFTLKYLFIEMISANGFNDTCMNLSDSD